MKTDRQTEIREFLFKHGQTPVQVIALRAPHLLITEAPRVADHRITDPDTLPELTIASGTKEH